MFCDTFNLYYDTVLIKEAPSLSPSLSPPLSTHTHTHTHTHTLSLSHAAPPTTTVSLGSNSIATPLLQSDIELECHAESSPASSLTWTLNDIHNITELSQESGSRYELIRTNHNLTEFTSRLTVRAVTYGDSGTYTCTGTNRLGRDSDSISVSVEGMG